MPSASQALNELRSDPRRFGRRLRGAVERRLVTSPRVEAAIARQFQRLYYYAAEVDSRRTWRGTNWLGTRVLKCPLDLWLYQELLTDQRPELIIETGTHDGGSAHYLATLCELLGSGEVVTIDIERFPTLPEHPRLSYLTASSTDDATVERVRRMAEGKQPVMVILDSDHTAAHVLDELRRYSDLVTPGSYLIVEDTNVNGHPVAPEFGPGPMEALRAFLREDRRYEVDTALSSKFLMTMNPQGVLRRVR